MKDLLEQLSVALGFDGEINEEVMAYVDALAERSDDVIEALQFRLRYYNNTGWIGA